MNRSIVRILGMVATAAICACTSIVGPGGGTLVKAQTGRGGRRIVRRGRSQGDPRDHSQSRRLAAGVKVRAFGIPGAGATGKTIDFSAKRRLLSVGTRGSRLLVSSVDPVGKDQLLSTLTTDLAFGPEPDLVQPFGHVASYLAQTVQTIWDGQHFILCYTVELSGSGPGGVRHVRAGLRSCFGQVDASVRSRFGRRRRDSSHTRGRGRSLGQPRRLRGRTANPLPCDRAPMRLRRSDHTWGSLGGELVYDWTMRLLSGLLAAAALGLAGSLPASAQSPFSGLNETLELIADNALNQVDDLTLEDGALHGLFEAVGATESAAPYIAKKPDSRFSRLREAFRDLQIAGKAPKQAPLENGAIRGLLRALGDPYATFEDVESVKRAAEVGTGTFSGVGMQVDVRAGSLAVIAPVEGSPASRAGIRPGDRIMAIDGRPTQGLSADEAARQIRGPRGSSVSLRVERTGLPTPIEITVVRDTVEDRMIASRPLPGNVGYLHLWSLGAGAYVSRVKEALGKFSTSRALVLDLRRNPGGNLATTLAIGRLFLPKGPLLRIVSRGGRVSLVPEKDADWWAGAGWPPEKPMAVLIDQGTAGVAEILAGALHETRGAVLVGSRTFGKGALQTDYTLSSGAHVSFTTDRYTTVRETEIAGKGLTPDVEVPFGVAPSDMAPSLDEAIDSGNDPQLSAALGRLAVR